MLPFDFEILVAPRHIDVSRFEVSAVLAHLRHVERKPAAQRFGHCLPDLLLRLARFRPVALNHLVPMFDLDECAPGVVARSPQRHEFLARFQAPLRRVEQMRNSDRQLRVVGLQHADLSARGDPLPEAVLRFEQRAINADT